MPVTCEADAVQVLAWYRLHWRIEDWHRVLKTGCRVAYLGHRTGDRLERAVTIQAVIAWRLPALARLGGYLARNHDPPPGPPILWEGYMRLGERVATYETLRDLQWLAVT